MSGKSPYAKEMMERVVDEVRGGAQVGKTAAKAGISVSTLRLWLRAAGVEPVGTHREPPEEGFEDEMAGGKRALRSISSEVRTVEDALRKGEVDLARWTVERCKVNSWEVGTKDPKSGRVTVTQLWQVCVWLKAVGEDELQLERIAERTIEQMRTHAPLYKLELLPSPRTTGKMLELDLIDVHIGLLSWAPETGVNYDTEIASSRYMRMLDSLIGLARGYSFEAVLLPTGNDFLHIDTERGSTTGDTAVDVDTRATRVFEQGKLLMIAAIDRLLLVAPKVIVPIVPGNHDRFSMLHLGHTLAAWYRNMGSRVEIDFSPKLRKYVEWGRNLVGYTHGSEEKKEKLPMLMASEAKQAWARTLHHAWRIGHLHHARSLLVPMGDTSGGVWIKQCAALTSRDAWHTKHGFVGAAPAASGTIWDREEGPVVELAMTVKQEG
jgi:hypothetical protein